MKKEQEKKEDLDIKKQKKESVKFLETALEQAKMKEMESKKEKEAVENLTKAIWNIVAKLKHVEIVDSPVLIANLENIQESPLNIQNIIYADNKIFAFDSLSNTCLVISPENGEMKINHNNLELFFL